MSVNTGIELLDAIINNPMQAIILFGIIIFMRQMFFKHDSIFRDDIRHLKWSLKYDFDKQLENLVGWLERRDKAYNEWAKKQTKKKFLKLELVIWSCLFIPLLIWNASLPKHDIINQILIVTLIVEYFGIMIFSLYRYKHPKMKREKIAN